MMTRHRKASKREIYLGVGILVLLACIGLEVVRQQTQLNPAVIALRPRTDAIEGSTAVPAVLLAKLPKGLVVMTPLERFDAETLYEKIDGQAELYLSAGFVALTCQRLKAVDRPDLWLEAFVYDMGSAANAFAVYTRQRREGGAPVDDWPLAYHIDNAFFVAHGSLYIELIASEASEQAEQMMHAVAAGLVAANPATEAAATGLEWFPPTGRDPNSLTVIPTDAFGFDKLDQVVTVTYTLNGSELTAFVSRRATGQEAQSLADAFRQFLVTYGGQVRDPEPSLPSAHVIEIMDTYDIVFAVGPFLGGVYEALDRKTAAGLALRLEQTLKGVAGEK